MWAEDERLDQWPRQKGQTVQRPGAGRPCWLLGPMANIPQCPEQSQGEAVPAVTGSIVVAREGGAEEWSHRTNKHPCSHEAALHGEDRNPTDEISPDKNLSSSLLCDNPWLLNLRPNKTLRRPYGTIVMTEMWEICDKERT